MMRTDSRRRKREAKTNEEDLIFLVSADSS